MKLFAYLAVFFMALAFTFNTNSQSLKDWTVESYQGFELKKSTQNLQRSNFYFDEAWVHYNSNVNNTFDLNFSARFDGAEGNKVKAELYSASINWRIPVEKSTASIKLGRFDNAWFNYTYTTFDNYTFAKPLSITQFSTTTRDSLGYIVTDKVYPGLLTPNSNGLQLGLTSKAGTFTAAINNTESSNVKSAMFTATFNPVKFNTKSKTNLLFGGVFYSSNAIADSNVFSNWVAGGNVDVTRVMKFGALKLGTEVLFNSNRVSDSTAAGYHNDKGYVGTAYAVVSPVKFAQWSLLVKGDYFVPNTENTDVNNVAATVALIWKPVIYSANVNVGLNYTYTWMNAPGAKAYDYTLSLRTGILF